MITTYRTKKTKKDEGGFTLVELILVVGLIAITAGISGDIILSLVRSFNKTRATNEIERVGTIVMTKMEKELKSSNGVESPSTASCASSISFQRENSETSSVETITYATTPSGGLTRNDGNGAVPILDPASQHIALPTSPPTTPFCLIQQSPDVVQIQLNLSQVNTGGSVSFTGNVRLEQTVVLRGTY